MDKIVGLSQIKLVFEYPFVERRQIYFRLLKTVFFIALINIAIGVAFLVLAALSRVSSVYILLTIIVFLMMFSTMTMILARKQSPPLVVLLERSDDSYDASGGCLVYLFLGILLFMLFTLFFNN